MTTATAEETKSNQPIWITRRPQILDDVKGQDHIVKSLKSNIASKSRSHVFIFVGPSGVGKTTVAEAAARMIGADKGHINTVNGGKQGKVDDMRAFTSSMEYFPQSGESKVLIVDECQNLTKEAWEALLISCERTPDHAYWFFCTTEKLKIPPTMETRSTMYTFNSINEDVIIEELMEIVADEEYTLSMEVLDLVAQAASGSMRRALNYLAKVNYCQSIEEATKLLNTADEEEDGNKNPYFAFTELLLQPCSDWNKYAAVLRRISKFDQKKCIRSSSLGFISKVAPTWSAEQVMALGPSIEALVEAPYSATIADMTYLAIKVIAANQDTVPF